MMESLENISFDDNTQWICMCRLLPLLLYHSPDNAVHAWILCQQLLRLPSTGQCFLWVITMSATDKEGKLGRTRRTYPTIRWGTRWNIGISEVRSSWTGNIVNKQYRICENADIERTYSLSLISLFPRASLDSHKHSISGSSTSCYWAQCLQGFITVHITDSALYLSLISAFISTYTIAYVSLLRNDSDGAKLLLRRKKIRIVIHFQFYTFVGTVPISPSALVLLFAWFWFPSL
jgi:hypothetical protein